MPEQSKLYEKNDIAFKGAEFRSVKTVATKDVDKEVEL